MNAHRLIAKNENGYLHIHLPKDISSKEVEVILLPQQNQIEKKIVFKEFFGCWENKKTIEEIDEQIKAMRNEWERDI